MTKTDLIVQLAKLRVRLAGIAEGFPEDFAKENAEKLISASGYNRITALGIPEAGIVAIVESYMTHLPKRMIELGGPEHFQQANDEVIDRIEAYRSGTGAKGSGKPPHDIDKYVFYRMNLEVPHSFGSAAESYGLSESVTKALTHTAKGHYLRATDSSNSSVSSGVKGCFVATACCDSSDAPTVVILRRYREIVLKRSSIGRAAVLIYYRVSPPLARAIVKFPTFKSFGRYLLGLIALKLRGRYKL
jgi:hypothetical protein